MKMTNKEWRRVAEDLISKLEYEMSIDPKWEDGLDTLQITCRENGAMKEKLFCIQNHIDKFKEVYLNRERCNDFDEFERSIG